MASPLFRRIELAREIDDKAREMLWQIHPVCAFSILLQLDREQAKARLASFVPLVPLEANSCIGSYQILFVGEQLRMQAFAHVKRAS